MAEEEDPDAEVIESCLKSVYNLATAAHRKRASELMSGKLLSLFANDDWRHKSAVLLVVSELSSFISGSHL